MDVSSTTATVSSTQNVNNTKSTSANSKADNKNSTSFEEEMQNAKNETQKEQTAEKQEEKIQEQKSSTKVEKKDEQQKLEGVKESVINKNNEKKGLNPADILTLNIQNLIDAQNVISNKTGIFEISIKTDVDLTKNIGETLNYQNIEMTENDAKFFADIVQNNESGVQNIMAEIQHAVEFGDEAVQKTATVSKTLLNALQNTVKTGQAVRIDFGNNIAVIMRVSKDGSIMANFIPGDKAVENYLKNNIDFLRQRFEEEDIPYSQLSYSQHQNKEHRQQNKEDRNE